MVALYVFSIFIAWVVSPARRKARKQAEATSSE
jgi:Sec-independent protein secretion pathway component TatC